MFANRNIGVILAVLFTVVVWGVWQTNQHKYYGAGTQSQAAAASVPQPYPHTGL
jgi:hypothetical protein